MELSVGELAQVLGQSQPRVSRHLRILADAGVARTAQGRQLGVPDAWRRATASTPMFALIDAGPTQRPRACSPLDAARPEAIRADRAEAANRYFAAHAEIWDQIRSLHVAESEVERAIDDALGRRPLGRLVDIGTGTGRMIELFGPRAEPGDRHRPLVGDAAPGPGQARGGRHRSRACARATCTRCRWPTAAPTRSSSTRSSIMPTRRPPRSPRRRGCWRRAGPCWSSISPPTSARNCATRDAHIRLGFADEVMAGWFGAAGLEVDQVRASRGRRADRHPVARRQAGDLRSGRRHERRSTSSSATSRCSPRPAATSPSASNSSRPRREKMAETCGSRSRRWRRSARASSRSPMAPAARPASAPTPRSSGSSQRDRPHAGRASDLRRREPRRDRRDRPRLLGARRSPHRRLARRSARAGQELQPHPDGYANAAELVAGLKAVAPFDISVAAYPEMPPGFGDPRSRPRQSQAQGRRRRRPRDHPVLLLARLLPPLPRRSGGGGHRRRDRAGHPAGVERRPDAAVRRSHAAPRFRTGSTACSKGSTTCPRRASWSRRRSPPNCAASSMPAASATSTSTP